MREGCVSLQSCTVPTLLICCCTTAPSVCDFKTLTNPFSSEAQMCGCLIFNVQKCKKKVSKKFILKPAQIQVVLQDSRTKFKQPFDLCLFEVDPQCNEISSLINNV